LEFVIGPHIYAWTNIYTAVPSYRVVIFHQYGGKRKQRLGMLFQNAMV